MTDKKVARVKNRPKRRPLHRRNLLDFSHLKEKGFTYRLVNEVEGAVEAYEEAGWTVVEDRKSDPGNKRLQDANQVGTPVRRVVNKDHNAHNKTGILMKIPTEYYNEDKAEIHRVIDEKEKSIDPREKAKTNPEVYGEMKKEVKDHF